MCLQIAKMQIRPTVRINITMKQSATMLMKIIIAIKKNNFNKIQKFIDLPVDG